MARERCSATIIAWNEEANLRDCLESVHWADELVVVDSGSSDRTAEIAREFTDRIFVNPWPGMREQKNFAAQQAANPWILNLDADERVSLEAKQRILETLENPLHDGYSFPRQNFFLGKWMRHGGWYPDEVLRLYRKSAGEFAGLNPHPRVILKSGNSALMPTPLTHHTYTSFAQYISKQHFYADAAAREIAAEKDFRGISVARIFTKTVWKFLETYVIKRGFLDGPHGLVAALGSSFSAYMKQTRLWELGKSAPSDKQS